MGITLLECEWSDVDGVAVCKRCNKPSANGKQVRRRCRLPGEVKESLLPNDAKQEKYLGDWTKELLAKTTFGGMLPGGITEDFYKSVKTELGFAPTCDCPERVEWLNNADKLARSWWQKLTGK